MFTLLNGTSRQSKTCCKCYCGNECRHYKMRLCCILYLVFNLIILVYLARILVAIICCWCFYSTTPRFFYTMLFPDFYFFPVLLLVKNNVVGYVTHIDDCNMRTKFSSHYMQLRKNLNWYCSCLLNYNWFNSPKLNEEHNQVTELNAHRYI